VGGDLPPIMALSPDGSRVAALDIADQRKAAIFRLTGSGQRFAPLPPQPGEISSLGFSPDGAKLAITSLSGSVAVYEANDGSQVETLPGHAGPALAVAWTGLDAPTGLYTVGLDSELVSWSVTSTARLLTESGPPIALPDRAETFGHFVFGLTPRQGDVPETQIRLFRADLTTGHWTSWPAHLHSDEYVNQAMASRDGNRAVISVQDQVGHNHLDIWDLVQHTEIGHLALPPDAPKTFPIGLDAAVSPDGRTAYSSLDATRVGVFALPSGKYLRSFHVHFADPDGARVAAIPWRFDPHGRLLVAGYDTGPHTANGPYNLGPNDARPSNQRIAVVAPSTGRILAQAGLGDVIISSVSEWSHDGRLLALGTVDGTLTLYDAATLAVVARGGAVEPGYVSTATFAPDDKTLVESGTSGAINFWSVPALDRIASPLKLDASDATGTFAFYAPNGDVVGFVQSTPGTSSNQQRWFDLKAQPAQLARTACALAGADITRAQWQRYVGDRPYQHVCT
jgi:WD40 repeat protein